MIQRILVPTDGSELSGRALSVAEQLARAQGAELLFVRVVQPPTWNDVGGESYLSAVIYQEVIDSLRADATQSVERLAADARSIGLGAQTAVFEGFPAAQLLDYEAEIRPDLVVIASHGRTGLARFALGSVADRMVREGTAPVLIVRSYGPTIDVLEHAVVPLDGSALAEEALPIVESLAGKPLRSVHLIRSVQSHEEYESGSLYLGGIAGRLSTLGLSAYPEVSVEPPHEAIKRTTQTRHLVIMATHGRGGLDRLRHGSVAESVIRDMAMPVLLLRAGITASSAVQPAAGIRQECST